ncbi:hypothetical protein D9619_007012 [Psilocybe cf. subviscida]|uniref:Phosphoglycerate mutase-like protein n=1 Tax=Psilocybe cf. subviscida TaxID=2480587 RepID=A0A8H5B209_9AGAR|nr:hypothetical protein D9619_007012 [Psilocybe cf. subviscida]
MSTTSTDQGKMLGVVVMVRHGDRQGFYQDPSTYTPSNTAITPLGNLESFNLGQLVRSIYLNESSSSFIAGVNNSIVQDGQVQVRADGGGERGVIFNSAVSMLQGLWPPNANYKSVQADGTTAQGPLNGYQTVPIESVEPDNDVSLEGWTSCNTFNTATNAFYNSQEFKQVAAENADFLSQLPQYLDGRPATLENMWNIFDYLNVQFIHNATFATALPPTFREQARALANFHERGVFSSPQPDGIGNIAGHTVLPSIIQGLQNIIDPTNQQKFMLQAMSYKPFISLFNMTGVAEVNPQLSGIVEYASAVALEVRQPSTGGEPVIRFMFKNGTNDDAFVRYSFMNSTSDVPVSTFINTLQPFAFSDLPTWCQKCSNTKDRGCANIGITSSPVTMVIGSHDMVGPVGAGFIGASVTLVVMLAALAVLSFTGFLSFGRKEKSRARIGSESGSEYEK